MIVELDVFDKVHKKLADYGFILRYLDGKDDIT
jgi:LAS superfamily LD-carboxypeptidase LdcB